MSWLVPALTSGGLEGPLSLFSLGLVSFSLPNFETQGTDYFASWKIELWAHLPAAHPPEAGFNSRTLASLPLKSEEK